MLLLLFLVFGFCICYCDGYFSKWCEVAFKPASINNVKKKFEMKKMKTLNWKLFGMENTEKNQFNRFNEDENDRWHIWIYSLFNTHYILYILLILFNYNMDQVSQKSNKNFLISIESNQIEFRHDFLFIPFKYVYLSINISLCLSMSVFDKHKNDLFAIE